jgi:hypothetical protein
MVPQAFVLADHCFPAALPAEGEGDCIKVLRIENASLIELSDAFLEATRGFVVPAGSVVVLTSVSKLAEVGTAKYAADFVAARARLLAAFQGGIIVVHGFPIPYGGIGDSGCIRSIGEILQWLTTVNSASRDISTSRELFRKLVLEPGSPAAPETNSTRKSTGSHYASVPNRLELPADLDGKKTDIFHSDPGLIRYAIKPINEQTETELLNELVNELNSKFLTNIGVLVCDLNDTVEDQKNKSALRYIVIGASHAGRIADCLEENGCCVVDLSVPGWTIAEANVEKMTAELVSVLAEQFDGDTVVVYNIFDNSCYLSLEEDGSTSQPIKLGGSYHIPGSLVMADRNAIKILFSKAIPLLRAGGECVKVLITPLMRYLKHGCCEDPGHVVNRMDEDYQSTMGERLNGYESWLKDIAFFKRIRNVKIFNPNVHLIMDERIKAASKRIASYWGSDPVHMRTEGYRVVAEALEDLMEDCDTGVKQRNTADKSGGGDSEKRARRESWISTDDAVANRAPEPKKQRPGEHRGGWRGRGRSWRGRRGWGRPRGGYRGHH